MPTKVAGKTGNGTEIEDDHQGTHGRSGENTPIVILRYKDGESRAADRVGMFEARAIAMQIENPSTPRRRRTTSFATSSTIWTPPYEDRGQRPPGHPFYALIDPP